MQTVQLTRLAVAAAVATLFTSLLLASTTARASAGARHATAGAMVKVAKTKLGLTLVNAKGFTLYLLTADMRTKGNNACYSTCAKFWPPLLTTGRPRAGPGANARRLGVAKRTNGTEQVTCEDHRLYLFVKDKARGQTNGEGFKGFGGPVCTATLATKPCVWYAISPAGAAKTPSETKTTTAAGTTAAGKYGCPPVTVLFGIFRLLLRALAFHER